MTTLFSASYSLGSMSTIPTLEILSEVFAPRALIERTLQIMKASSTQPRTASSGAAGASATAAAAQVGTSARGGNADQGIAGAGVDDGGVEGDAVTIVPEAALSMEQLVRDHADAVYRVALSVTRDPSLAEDASQDALIKAWESLPSFRGDAPLRHWILRITHNVSISLLRKRREQVVAPFDMPDRGTPQGAVEHQVHERMAIDSFKEALGELDELSRSIIVLREVEGLSYAEISDVLDLPMPTVRTRLLRGRRQLANSLDGWQP